MKRSEVSLHKHSAGWEREAAGIISSLRKLLADSVSSIQHIGSTAVRGILAVPVIDIAVGLTETANVTAVLNLLGRYGYRRIPTDETGCIRMSYPARDKRFDSCRLWVTRAGSKAWNDLIAFRAYLNNHVFAANEYETLKQSLVQKFSSDSVAYSAAKSAFIQGILRLSFTDQFLGKRLTIVVDRPSGTIHPNYPDLRYPINYGFVPGIPAPDGENLDAYIIGETKPMRRFTGTVIAVIHRWNDVEDKLVVAPTGMVTYEPQIKQAVAFQEQYFDTSIICIYEKSCGAVVFRVREDRVIEYLVLHQHRSGTWSVPKGHIDADETEEQTALREVWEETGLRVSLIPGFRREMSYTVSAKASKNVVIFLAAANGALTLGENEISDAVWAEKNEAITRLGGRSIGRIIESAEKFIRSKYHL